MRPENLFKIINSIDFNYVDEWIIVYDGSKLPENFNLFEGRDKIKEYVHEGTGISGNPQRNYALDRVTKENTFLYFLDDDNLIHKDLFQLLDFAEENKFYTFDQTDRADGDQIECGKIDTAMFLIDRRLCKNLRWPTHLYEADFKYIYAVYQQNIDNWIYVKKTLSYYNILKQKD